MRFKSGILKNTKHILRLIYLVNLNMSLIILQCQMEDNCVILQRQKEASHIPFLFFFHTPFKVLKIRYSNSCCYPAKDKVPHVYTFFHTRKLRRQLDLWGNISFAKCLLPSRVRESDLLPPSKKIKKNEATSSQKLRLAFSF